MSPRAWAEVDLSAIRENTSSIRAFLRHGAQVMTVVKADGYGHGAVNVARAALESGATWLGVATVDEGVRLRESFPSARICVFAAFLHDESEEVVRNRLIPFLSDVESARVLDAEALRQDAHVEAHLEIDTGMGRSGASVDRPAELAESLASMRRLELTGLATHFPSAENDPDFTRDQLGRFIAATKAITESGLNPNILHAANSAGICAVPESHLDLVRAGLLTYGLRPDLPESIPIPAVRPALSLKARIALIRELPAGSSISYGRTHILKRSSRVATIQIGYGDGYPRELSGKGSVLVAGRRAPILGRICMDVTVADVTEIPEAREGDEAVLIGSQGREQIRVQEIARLIGTTVHDVTTRLTSRVNRVYSGET